jgi:hypothetical protein
MVARFVLGAARRPSMASSTSFAETDWNGSASSIALSLGSMFGSSKLSNAARLLVTLTLSLSSLNARSDCKGKARNLNAAERKQSGAVERTMERGTLRRQTAREARASIRELCACERIKNVLNSSTTFFKRKVCLASTGSFLL